MPRLAALLLSLAAPALLAGCGGQPSREEYEADVRAVGERFDAEEKQLAEAFQGANTPEDVGKAFERFQRTLREAAGDLEDVEPPDDAEGAHDKFVGGLNDLAGELDPGIRAGRSGDVEQLTAFVTGLQSLPSARRLEEARLEFRDKGYRIGTR
jgi:hypothetical protein